MLQNFITNLQRFTAQEMGWNGSDEEMLEFCFLELFVDKRMFYVY